MYRTIWNVKENVEKGFFEHCYFYVPLFDGKYIFLNIPLLQAIVLFSQLNRVFILKTLYSRLKNPTNIL